MVENKIELEENTENMDELEQVIQQRKQTPTPAPPNMDSNQLYIQCKKNDLFNILDSGTVKDEMAQYALIDGFVLDVFQKHPQQQTFIQYLNDQNKLKDLIKELGLKRQQIDEQITKHIQDYGNNARDMYNLIKEKL